MLRPFLALALLLPLPSALPLATPVSQVATRDGLAGTWRTEIVVSGQAELETNWIEVVVEGGGAARIAVTADDFEYEITGSHAPGRLTLRSDSEVGSLAADLALEGERLVGTIWIDGRDYPVDALRGERPPAEKPQVVDFSVERPTEIALAGLPEALSERVDARILAVMDTVSAVGVSAAFVLEGEVVDERSYGWEDFHARIPASSETLYRWASISKPLTAATALLLADEGKLDLDRDARAYLPEFPEKAFVFTSRQLLCHQSGVVHYRDMLPRTLKTYDSEHPWDDAIVALDMFNESPLLFEPGTAYSYSTPAFTVLGAVIQRAGEDGTFVEQVTRCVLEPAGMTSMTPDLVWVVRPHETAGYFRLPDGRVVRSGDDDIQWKLGAGGWHSTVGDLARFGSALIGPDLLPEDVKAAMWTEQRTSSGQRTGMGLGIGVGTIEVAGLGQVEVISHSGGQNKTSTYLVCAPEWGAAVALMCNTSGTGMGDLGRELLAELIEGME